MLLMDERSKTLSRIEPRAVLLAQSGVTTSPLDRVTLILIRYKYFKYINQMLKFLLAFTRAGFDSQLLQIFLGLLLRGKGLLAVEVRPIQSSFRSFSLNKMTRAFERACIVSK
jgi:hypothetical protein